ncbi:nucleotidyl transferase AbiEii/AbiGii toxin family protein [Mucilaginibacter ginsenosidivorax]|uniref:Nucleotidyl transferase AbiEii/AbiGii toxin family protein n=1 Tax=Mucilaginibacter ginsenosidivorax TaxID=862126 RepID=A0A5B8W527_9SPHI|nr:nucleotidyl transferase AbiEii/AbiGii toxin family protein [Mucilaginibacter ginsenosidivorax]QEC78974.1 nucleotidyl transferase AbiEii/AbiGii toxin family protein [Mucilaginibacter ginsenosidivorax]
MTLHNNPELFKDAITATAQQMKIAEIYVEKDYWVTLALKTIFESEIGKEAVFKGGTALSKCYKLIERFSEDIDLVVLRHEGESDNQLKTKIRNLTNLVGTVMPEIEVEGITRKMGMNRKTAHAYAKGEFKGEFGQIREHIVVEATWLGNFEPYTTAEVSSFIAEMMRSNGQQALIEEYGLQAFTVRVLTKERTICEKIMSLVRFSYTEKPYEDLAKKIRHVYDIHMLLKDAAVAAFFDSEEFDKLLNMVGKDDILTYKNNNGWLSAPPQNAIIYAESEATWAAIRHPYRTTFKDLVTGSLPEEAELIATLQKIAKRLGSVKWNIGV